MSCKILSLLLLSAHAFAGEVIHYDFTSGKAVVSGDTKSVCSSALEISSRVGSLIEANRLAESSHRLQESNSWRELAFLIPGRLSSSMVSTSYISYLTHYRPNSRQMPPLKDLLLEATNSPSLSLTDALKAFNSQRIRVLNTSVSLFGLREFAQALPLASDQRHSANIQVEQMTVMDSISPAHFASLLSEMIPNPQHRRPEVQYFKLEDDSSARQDLRTQMPPVSLVFDIAGLASRQSFVETLKVYSQVVEVGGYVVLWIPTHFYLNAEGGERRQMTAFAQSPHFTLSQIPEFELVSLLGSTDIRFLSSSLRDSLLNRQSIRYDGLTLILKRRQGGSMVARLKEDFRQDGVRVLSAPPQVVNSPNSP